MTPSTSSSRRAHLPWRLRFASFYPPYLGAGIRVRRVGDDPLAFEVEMKLRFWNRNYVGTHFGGSLYAMCDPFFMLILIAELGRDYLVWDKAATVRFRRPGRGRVRAHFAISRQAIEAIRAEADRLGRVEPTFTARVVDEAGELVTEIEKVISVRRRDAARPAAARATG